MKKLNNKGFAISTVIYSLLIIATLIMGMLLSTMVFSKKSNDDFVYETEKELNNQDMPTDYSTLLNTNNTMNDDKMVDFEHNECNSICVNDDNKYAYRYVGANPNNYVKFNNELWRIVGLFNINKTATKIQGYLKIIRNDYIDTMQIHNESEGQWYDEKKYDEYNQFAIVRYLNTDYYNTLDSNAKKMIYKNRWYISTFPDTFDTNTITPASLFTAERGTNGKYHYWDGNIGLIYPSDFGYASGNDCSNVPFNTTSWHSSSGCIGKNWIYNASMNQWTMGSLKKTDGIYQFMIGSNQSYLFSSITKKNEIRPTLYLNNNVKIIAGNGTNTNPYILS